jgi:hypothetical protein
VTGVHGQPRGGTGDRRQYLGALVAAQFPGDQPAEEHGQAGQQGRDDAEGGQAVAEEHDLQAADQGDQRRLVDVAPVEVAGSHPAVELVEVVAVPGGQGEQEHHEGAGRGRQRQPADRRQDGFRRRWFRSF